ncbi:MAG: hypothetical protein B6D73_00685 [gamma proteobacterium symbiont of Stewartia floridana]|nr:MAG: hypothetical protein B6D73_00685 [gamma proteobacterium symbiont of Stewartia floridana]
MTPHFTMIQGFTSSFFAVLGLTLAFNTLHAAETLTLGVLAYLPKAQMISRYQPLVDYLSDQLGDRKVELLPLAYDGDEIEAALASGSIDLLLTNPSHFIKLRTQNDLSGAMLTQVVVRNGQPVSVFGGVIITTTQRPDINTLKDLSNMRIAAADPRSLGGFQAQVFEAISQGVELYGPIDYLKKHDLVVNAVLSGKADAGFIRSGVLEGLVRAKKLDLNRIKVLNPQKKDNFPFLLSTRLYPEWPLVALPQLAPHDVRRIASALLALRADHPAAHIARIGGYDPPADYLPVEELARALRVPPYDRPPEFTLEDIWAKYHYEIVIILVAMSIIAFLLFLLWRRNNELLSSSESLRRAASVFTHAREGIAITDACGAILDVNEAFERITGFSREDVIGHNPRILKSGRQDSEFYQAMWQDLLECQEWKGEIWNRRKNGEVYAEQLTISAVLGVDGEVESYVGLFSDITPQKDHLRQLEHMAHFDALTGLPNRLLLTDRLSQAMLQTHRSSQLLAVGYIDLDGFKDINDNHGHEMGDLFLTTLASRMKKIMREGDTIARLGGDEFVAVFPGILNECSYLFTRLLEAIGQPVHAGESVLNVTASIGITYYPQSLDISPDELLDQADQAMYLAKKKGMNQIHLFELN